MRKNVPTPNASETINNFITWRQKLAENCDYDEERANQVRDHAISYIRDKNLKSKLYQEKSIDFKQTYGNRRQVSWPRGVNSLSDQLHNIQICAKKKGRCWRCDKAGVTQENVEARVSTSVESGF